MTNMVHGNENGFNLPLSVISEYRRQKEGVRNTVLHLFAERAIIILSSFFRIEFQN